MKWGFSPKIVHWLYTAIVRPILLYGIQCLVAFPRKELQPPDPSQDPKKR